MFRRAYLSVKGRKTKNIIMLLFLFIVSTLVLCSISIKNATNKSMELAKESLGGTVTLSMDMSKLRDEFKKEDQSSIEDKKSQMQDMHEKMNNSNIKLSDVQKISSIKYVNDIKYTFNVNATEKSFSLYESTSNNNDNRGPERNNSLEVEAINTFELDDDYVNKKIELVNGTSFDEESKDVAIISYELAEANNLSVSDNITLTDSDGEEHTLKIIGIYQYKENKGFTNYNKIYIDINSAESFLSSEEYNDGDYTITSAVFYLNNPDKVDEFKTEANKLVTDLSDRNLTLDIDTNSYDRMVSSIKGVQSFSNIVLVVVIVAAIVIISLIIINSLKERNYEIGVLLSLGEKKIKIIGQFILELLMITFISFILAIGTSKFVSQKFANVILDNQASQTEDFNQNKRGNGFRGDAKFMESNSNVSVIDKLNVDVSSKDIIILVLVESLIIVISMVIPSIKILNSDPKDILSRKE